MWPSCAGRGEATRDRPAWRASLSQVQVILCPTAWVGVLIVAAVLIRIVLSSALPLLSGRGAHWVARLTVASVVSGTIYVLPEFQRAILLRIRLYSDIKWPDFLMVIP